MNKAAAAMQCFASNTVAPQHDVKCETSRKKLKETAQFWAHLSIKTELFTKLMQIVRDIPQKLNDYRKCFAHLSIKTA